MVIEKSKRLVEHQKNVLILLDSITRLARAYNTDIPPSGKVLSGGLDSATVLAVATRRDGLAAYCLSVDYGQKHKAELEASHLVAASLDAAEHKVVKVDLSTFGGSALTGSVRSMRSRSGPDSRPAYRAICCGVQRHARTASAK